MSEKHLVDSITGAAVALLHEGKPLTHSGLADSGKSFDARERLQSSDGSLSYDRGTGFADRRREIAGCTGRHGMAALTCTLLRHGTTEHERVTAPAPVVPHLGQLKQIILRSPGLCHRGAIQKTAYGRSKPPKNASVYSFGSCRLCHDKTNKLTPRTKAT